MFAIRADFGKCCWSADYVLGHCEGFRVESSAGRLGYVDGILRRVHSGSPLALRVRTGREGHDPVVVMIGDVLELHAESESILVRTPSRRVRLTPPRRAVLGDA